MLVCSDSHFLVNVHVTVLEERSPTVHFKNSEFVQCFHGSVTLFLVEYVQNN